MADNEELSEQQIRHMERKLLGYEASSKTVAEIKKSRKIKRDPKLKPYIEVTPVPDDLIGLLYRVELVRVDGKRVQLFAGLYDDELKEEIERYRADGSEVRMARISGR